MLAMMQLSLQEGGGDGLVLAASVAYCKRSDIISGGRVYAHVCKNHVHSHQPQHSRPHPRTEPIPASPLHPHAVCVCVCLL